MMLTLRTYRLASFGGAGGQHACEIAQLLGIKTVLVHRHSSILSAYGLALADRVYEVQQPSATTYSADTHSDEDRRRVRGELKRRLDAIEEDVKAELKRQGFEGDRVRVERALNMRFEGTDTAIMVVPKPEDGDGKDDEDFGEAFRKEYKSEYGFLLAGKNVVVDDVKVTSFSRGHCELVLTQGST
jgi:5-oxoprolinase (ATP-hydrolysing)